MSIIAPSQDSIIASGTSVERPEAEMGAAVTSDGAGAWLLARVAIATLLVMAAGAKGWTMFALGGHVWPRDTDQILAAAQVACELGVAAWLLAGVYARLVHRLALGLFGVFSMYTGWLALGGAPSCGCFGAVRVSPWLALALDLGVLAALIGFPPPDLMGRTRGWPLLRAWLASAGIAGTLAAALLLASPSLPTLVGIENSGRLEVLDPAAWVGQSFPLLPYIVRDRDLSSGNWLVVLFRADCEHCRRLIQNLDQYRGKSVHSEHVMLIEVPPRSLDAKPLADATPGAALAHLEADRIWFVQAPVLVRLADGMVTEALAVVDVNASRFEGS
jgi:hypothetical protein